MLRVQKIKSYNISNGLILKGLYSYAKIELNKDYLRITEVEKPSAEGFYLSKNSAGKVSIPFEIKRAYKLFNRVDVLVISENPVDLQFNYHCMENPDDLQKTFTKGLYVNDCDASPNIKEFVWHEERAVNSANRVSLGNKDILIEDDMLITCHLGEKIYMEAKRYCGEEVMTYPELIERYGAANQFLKAYNKVCFRYKSDKNSYILVKMFKDKLKTNKVRIDRLRDSRTIISGMLEVCELSGIVTDPIVEQRKEVALCNDCDTHEDDVKKVIREIRETIEKKNSIETVVDEIRKETEANKENIENLATAVRALSNCVSAFGNKNVNNTLLDIKSDYLLTEELNF